VRDRDGGERECKKEKQIEKRDACVNGTTRHVEFYYSQMHAFCI